MMTRKIVKRCMTSALALALVFSAVVPAVKVEAAGGRIERRYIYGDGVRLRREGHQDGEILELMYQGEPINYYVDVYGSDPEYNYMQRLKTGSYGYVNHDHAWTIQILK